MLQALAEAGNEVDWAYWPSDLKKFIMDWSSGSDSKWRSNVLWFDYLHAYTSETPAVQPCTFSTLLVPIAPLVSSDMSAGTLVEFLKGHFTHTDTHAIAGMVHLFANSFVHFYTELGTMQKEVQLAVDIVSLEDAQKVTGEVKAFLTVAMAGFQSYYGGVDFGKLMKERAMGVKDLITDQVMHTKVHEILLQVYASANASKEAIYHQKLKDLAGIQCIQLAIEPLFCIDQVRSHNSEPIGYQWAIDSLREIATTTSPTTKLSVIISTTRKICECIDEYWKGTPQLPAEELVINADQILTIFVYITLKARVRNLMGHIFLIMEFVRTDVQQSSYGYYLATLEAAIEHILLMGERVEGKGNESFFTCTGD